MVTARVWHEESTKRRARRYPRGHAVTRRGIRCQGSAWESCQSAATRCEYSHYSVCGVNGVSFFYYCDRHWIIESPDGTSPRDRAWVAFEAKEKKAPEKDSGDQS